MRRKSCVSPTQNNVPFLSDVYIVSEVKACRAYNTGVFSWAAKVLLDGLRRGSVKNGFKHKIIINKKIQPLMNLT